MAGRRPWHWQVSHDIEHIPRRVPDVGLYVHLQICGQRERLRLQRMVNVFLKRAKVAARGGKPFVDMFACDLKKRNARVGGTRQAYELFQRVGTMVRGVIYVQDRDRAMRTRVERLAEELRMLGIHASFENAG